MTIMLLGRIALLTACLGSEEGTKAALPPSRLAVREGTAWQEW